MLEEEKDTYFKNVVRDAVKDLERKGIAYLFNEEQLSAFNQCNERDVDIKFDGDFFIIQEKKKKIGGEK